MCKCYMLEYDDVVTIAEEEAEVTYAGYVLRTDKVFLDLNKDEDDGTIYLDAYYWHGDEPSFGPRVKIDYCPFCGRHLKREEAPKY